MNGIEALNYVDSYLESKDINGLTPLHWAAMKGHENIVKLLLAAKANVEAKDSDGMTPLHYAAMRGHENVVKLLLAAKVNVEAVTNKGSTPLYLAAMRGHENVVKLLLAAKANVEAITNDGWTPLHWAAMYGYKNVVKLLLAAKANVEAVNNKGWTPLHWAAMNGHKNVVGLFLESGANDKGLINLNTLAAMAQAMSHSEVAQLITDYPKKLKIEIKQSPQRIAQLEKIIEQQQKDIDQLKQQVQLLLISSFKSFDTDPSSINSNDNNWRKPPAVEAKGKPSQNPLLGKGIYTSRSILTSYTPQAVEKFKKSAEIFLIKQPPFEIEKFAQKIEIRLPSDYPQAKDLLSKLEKALTDSIGGLIYKAKIVDETLILKSENSTRFQHLTSFLEEVGFGATEIVHQQLTL